MRFELARNMARKPEHVEISSSVTCSLRKAVYRALLTKYPTPSSRMGSNSSVDTLRLMSRKLASFARNKKYLYLHFAQWRSSCVITTHLRSSGIDAQSILFQSGGILIPGWGHALQRSASSPCAVPAMPESA